MLAVEEPEPTTPLAVDRTHVELAAQLFSAARRQFAALDELTELRKNRPDLEPFFREDRPEPFFVKNLENVQGDERDRIILSVAYGLNEETGRDSMSFGPLNRTGGERRLNVAVTRSREAIALVSSIRSDYIDLNRTKARGARLLRADLDYAEREAVRKLAAGR